MISYRIKSFMLGVMLCMSATGLLSAEGTDKNEDRCISTTDLKITDARVDIDKDGESEIQGKIVNDGDDSDYKNVRVRINFLDDDGEQIGSQIATVDRVVSDGSSEDFILKFNAPEGTENATYAVECAERD